MVGILNDEGPAHDLCGHIQHLSQDTIPIDAIVPETRKRLTCFRLLSLTLEDWHLGEGNDDEHHEHHQSDSHIGITNDGKVVDADVGLLGFAQAVKEYLSCSIATIANEVGKYDERSHSHS